LGWVSSRHPPSAVREKTVPTQRHLGAQRATFSSARQAFLDGDFEEALAGCDAISGSDDAIRYDVALLRARVLLRLGRPDRAVDALRACAYTPTSIEPYIVAKMLLGASYVRLGQTARGDALLVEAAGLTRDAHPTIRAEVALNLGIARCALQKYDDAEKQLASVTPEADIIYARAVEYLGWVAFTRGDFDLAAERFRGALRALAACKYRDRYVEANVLQGLTALSAELLQAEGWPVLQRTIRAFSWAQDGLAQPRFWVAFHASMLCEICGDADGARAWARDAESQAPNAAYRILAQCRIAAVFRGLKEWGAHREFIDRARETYATLSPVELGDDQKQLPVLLAEELAHAGLTGDAALLMSQYRDVIVPSLRSGLAEDRDTAVENTVDGFVREAAGDFKGAIRCFTSALRLHKRARFRRRGSEVALRLARLTGAKRYVDYATRALDGVDPSYWPVVQLGDLESSAGPSLTETERAILTLLVRGRAYKEIAAVRAISWKTVANHVQMLFRKFDVNSRGQLAAEALRRGLVALHDETGSIERA
jgi:DNA-binding CsgD family transcriptional regulator/predicted negative regulator of RcsB-dependent stress response